jgi:hypothetical protein
MVKIIRKIVKNDTALWGSEIFSYICSDRDLGKCEDC